MSSRLGKIIKINRFSFSSLKVRNDGIIIIIITILCLENKRHERNMLSNYIWSDNMHLIDNLTGQSKLNAMHVDDDVSRSYMSVWENIMTSKAYSVQIGSQYQLYRSFASNRKQNHLFSSSCRRT